MAIIGSQLVGIVSITGAEQGAAKLLSVGTAADTAGLKFAALAGGGATLAGAALVAFGVKVSEMAGNFQQGVNRLKTGGGDVQDSFTSLSNGIKQVAVASGVATTPLIQAMYQIVSANQRGAQAYATLAAAAQGAQIEQANVVDVTKILTTLQTNWGLTTFTAAQYMSGLVEAVKHGKITLEDLSTAMSPILPIAKGLGISFKDVAAAMSVQTNAGLNARQAATGLQAVFVNIENPTKKAASAMLQYGVNSMDVANKMKTSLPGAFQMLMDAALKVGPVGSVAFNRAMADMVGGGTRTAKTIDALTQHMKDWTGGVAAIGTAMKSNNKDVDGWKLAQSGFNIQMGQAKASLEVLGITIGQALLPVLTKIVSAIAPIIVAVTNWLVKNNAIMPILGALAAVITGGLIVAAVALVAAFWPVLAIGAGVALLVAGLALAFAHWGQLMDWISGKAEQLKIKHEEALVAMKIAADNHTAAMATKMIANEDKARAGILQKLKETTDPYQKKLLEHQLIVLNMQENANKLKLAAAEKDKVAELKKQADLHAAMLEAQKNFAQRFLDMIGSWIGDQMSKLGTMVSGWMTGLGKWKDQGLAKIGDFVTGIVTWFEQLPSKLLKIGVDMIQNLINGIGSMAGNLAAGLGSLVHNAVGSIPGLGGLLHNLGWFGYEQGGPVRETGLALVHKGEYVLSAAAMNALSRLSPAISPSMAVGGIGFGAPVVHVHVTVNPPDLNIDGYKLAGRLMGPIVSQIRNNTGVRF